MAYLDDLKKEQLTPNFENIIMEKSPGIDYSAGVDELQSERDFPRLAAYSQHLEKTPTEAQYKPRLLDRIAASMAGFSEGGLRGGGAGVESATNILRAPFGRALEEHNRQLSGLEAGANIESQLYNRQFQLGNQRFKQLIDLLNQKTEANRAADYSRSIDIQGQKAGDYGKLAGARATLADLQGKAATSRAADYGKSIDIQGKRGSAYERHLQNLSGKWSADRAQRAAEARERARLYGERTAKMGAKGDKERFVTPRDQAIIEGLALKEIRMIRPDLYEEFVKTEGEGKTAIAKVAPPIEEQPGMLYNWLGVGSGGLTGDKLVESQNRFREFQRLLEAHKQSALGRSGLSKSGYGSLEMPGVISEDEDVALEEDEDVALEEDEDEEE